jgi:tetratricopeptide (TPR) repeat protein
MKNTFALIISTFLLIVLNMQLVNASEIEDVDSLISSANNYTSVGSDFLNKKKYHDAELNFKNSINEWDKVNVYNEFSAYPYFQLAVLYRIIGDYPGSISYYNAAEKILIKASDEYKFLLGGLYSNLGYYYINYGDYQKSLDYYGRAIQILEPIKEDNGKFLKKNCVMS